MQYCMCNMYGCLLVAAMLHLHRSTTALLITIKRKLTKCCMAAMLLYPIYRHAHCHICMCHVNVHFSFLEGNIN